MVNWRVKPGRICGQRIAIAAQQAHAEGMKRGDARIGGELDSRRAATPTRERISSAALLVKVTARIADGGHVFGGDDMRDAVRDDARLAAAGAGQDQQRTFGVGNGFALLGIQPFEKIHEIGGHSNFNTRRGLPVPRRLSLAEVRLAKWRERNVTGKG